MNNDYYPDAWVILEIRMLDEKKSVLKIFSTYNDEFGVPARWTLNSGIVEASKSKNIWKFAGNSGSIYYCDVNKYDLNSLMKVVLNSWCEKNNVKIDVLELEDIKEVMK